MCFFFSSRRRHTRYIGDWSSDVCSSDLRQGGERGEEVGVAGDDERRGVPGDLPQAGQQAVGGPVRRAPVDQDGTDLRPVGRSEERRVGKECRSRGADVTDEREERAYMTE